MITHEQIVNFLRINNISDTASDAVISEALTAARWDAADVASALRALHGEDITSEYEEPLVHLYSDRAMSPSTISSLLHIEVRLTRKYEEDTAPVRSEAFESFLQHTMLTVVSLGIAGGIGFISMYYLGIGPFYE